jgi:hypothetical protein
LLRQNQNQSVILGKEKKQAFVIKKRTANSERQKASGQAAGGVCRGAVNMNHQAKASKPDICGFSVVNISHVE